MAAADGTLNFAGWAPHLDLQALDAEQLAMVQPLLEQDWLRTGIESRALAYASTHIVPEHYAEVRGRRLRHIDKTHAAVRERLVKEINYLTHRALQLDLEVSAGKQPRMQPDQLKRRAEELSVRLQSREKELEQMRHLVSATPVVVGAALVVPAGYLASVSMPAAASSAAGGFSSDPQARARIELLAMQAVIAHEQALGHTVKDVSADRCGWDLTAHPPSADGRLADARLIEVKGRARGADTITLTRNEIIAALNKPEQYWLAIVLVDEDDRVEGPFYVQRAVTQAPDWAEVSKALKLSGLLELAAQQLVTA